jgi:hypothetical protein
MNEQELLTQTMEKESEIPKQDQKDEIEEITEKAAELANVKSQLNDVEHEVEVTGRIQSGSNPNSEQSFTNGRFFGPFVCRRAKI